MTTWSYDVWDVLVAPDRTGKLRVTGMNRRLGVFS
jgi:hypothetical protein